MSRDRSVMTEEEDGNSSERYYDAKEYDEHHHRSEAFCANLEVEGWIPASQKEALVLLTGFSNTVDISFQSFGQLLSMTNICDSVYPIIFGWPAGTILTYRYASLAANTDENQRKFLHLIQGLQQTGIRKVHFLTHSMGVQTLLHAFSSSSSGERGPVSRCFQLVDPVFGTDDDDNNDNDQQQQQLLICKSITLLNPDFPLEAFVNHAFRSIRCICNQITVVGDRKDQALLLSSFINGLFHWMGYRIPPTLRSNHHHNQDGNGGRSSSSLHTKTGFHLERRLGQELDSIHFLPPPADEKKKKTAKDDVETGKEDTTINSSSYIPPPLLFQGEPEPVVIRLANDDNDDNDNDHSGIINNNKQWLDVDVIDTTNLDVNLDNVRHGGYNTNPILLKDLEDIIVTGRRAKDRPSLLFREGNVYSYCHAPSFLTM